MTRIEGILSFQFDFIMCAPLSEQIIPTKKYNHRVKNIIGKQVTEARRKFTPPLSQKELAARLELNGWKISRGTLAKIESGIREVTDMEVMTLAKTLKVSPDWLMDQALFDQMFSKEK